MDILNHMERYGHEQLLVCHEPSVGLKGFIAIHDTTLGPACGGVRIWPYLEENTAILDVLRLARAMTYKSAAAGLPLGGGKGLIMANPYKDKNKALLSAFGSHVETLGGRYIATEDVGMTPQDVVHMAQSTKHVVGLPTSMGGSGDTSPMTGLGVYLGMKACAKSVWGSDNLSDRIIVMQGFGHVGIQTAKHLTKEGAKLLVADVHEEARKKAQQLGATLVEPENIYEIPCDIFSPCALGGVLNSDTIPKLSCTIVAGGANNQLLNDKDGDALKKRGILYGPDYIINAGGIINVACEMNGTYQPKLSLQMTERIYETTERVIQISQTEDIPTYLAANQLAEDRLELAKRQTSKYN